MKRPLVGVFDSGIGGLTVLNACVRACPCADFLYYGDNGNAPYGSRTEGEITAFTREALLLFSRRGADAAVLACNTATAVCAEEMRKEFPFPVIGVEPAVKPAAESCANVLVLATPRTAESARLRSLTEKFKKVRFSVFGLPDFAGAIERHFSRGEPLTVSDHLPPREDYGGVVLGCTHYVFFRREIEDFYGVPAFEGGEGTANRLKSVLASCGFGTDNHLQPSLDTSEDFRQTLIFLGKWADFNRKIYKTNVCSQNN